MKSSPYVLSVGIETHVQLKSVSKLFSGADNNAKEATANTLINHIDFGLPGALPVLNKAAIELAVRAAFALNSRPQLFSKFDRKHYFYPDLPMGYQITQYDEPIILGGHVDFEVEGKPMSVNITRAHLEADAGKSLHPASKNFSLVDLNRAGTPLLEIVSEPDMHTPAEARAYVHELYLLMRYADVSEANLYYGNMRFDVNVSVSKGASLGIRTETKNLNSFRSVERAVTFEMARQIKLIEAGQQIIQETRGWDDLKGQGYSMRSKENADDYRYMPDPDLPPVKLTESYVGEIEKTMPKLPHYWRAKLAKQRLDKAIIESLLEGEVEYSLKHLEYLTKLDETRAKTIANWLINSELPLRRQLAEQNVSVKLTAGDLHQAYLQIYKLSTAGQLSSTNAKALITDLLKLTKLPKDISDYAASLNLIQNSDSASLSKVVDQVLKANPAAIKDIQAGQDKAVGFLVGQVMKSSKGQANPVLVSELIRSKIKGV